MVPHQCPECKSVIAHKPGCSLIPENRDKAERPEGLVGPDSDPKPNPPRKNIAVDSVDKTKLRRVIEEDLRKEATVEEMIEYAQKRGIKIPRHPETPPDYHDEPGRPYFGPHQVRHASDLKVEEEYILVSGEHRQRIRLEGIMYGERHSTWLLAYTMGLGENETEFSSGWHVFSEHNLHPHSDETWNGYMNKYLEFAPPATDCDCHIPDNQKISRKSEEMMKHYEQGGMPLA